MANRMIVSTKGLAQILRSVAPDVEVRFTIKRFKKRDDGMLYVNGINVGEAVDNPFNRFQDFSVHHAHAMRLRHILEKLEEQPITLHWRDERFMLNHVVV